MRISTFFLVLGAFNFCVALGIEDTVKLRETEIFSHTEKNPLEYVRTESDNKSVTEFLKKNPSFFIRNYGQSGLASISYRGTSAAQNEVYWNGIKINSPFTGQVDGNLLTLFPAQQISLSSSSNAIGTQISMNENDGDVFQIRYMSLNSVDLSGNIGYSNHNFFIRGGVSSIWAKNDYLVPNLYLKDRWKRQMHNALSMTNIKATLGYDFKFNQQLSASFWWSNNNREIAPLLTQIQPSKQMQYDRSVRAVLNYSVFVKKFSVLAHTSAISDVLNYRDEAINLNSHSQSFVSRNKVLVQYVYQKDKHTIHPILAMKYDYESANTDSTGFSSPHHRNISELCEQLFYNYKFLSLNGSVYQTIWNNKVFSTFNLGLGVGKDTRFIRHYFGLTAAKTLRIPSMNDLYWSVGGNPNLKPETGWKSDANWKMNHNYFQTKLTVYGQYTTNWILWSPINPTIWTPQNLKRVYGCGAEVFVSAGLFENIKKKWFVYFVSSYNWNRMINIDPISLNDASENKQLIYVPVHKEYTALRGGWRGVSASLDYTYFSKIYTSTDNSQSLQGYGLMDLHLSYEFNVKEQTITPSFGIYNLLNTQYQTMPNRAMPGRYYEVLIRFNLKG